MSKQTFDKVLYSKGNNDECYTPKYGVEPILKYIPKDKVIWCPFDTPKSFYVKLISKTNKVIYSHISKNQDFFTYEPNEHWDIIISNPPFTNKKKIFERALSFNKPFALLMTVTWLNDAAPVKIFKDKGLQLLLFDKRMEFHNCSKGRPTFSSAYFCHNFLSNDLILENLNKVKLENELLTKLF